MAFDPAARQRIYDGYDERRERRRRTITQQILDWMAFQSTAPTLQQIEYEIGRNISVGQMVAEEIVTPSQIVELFLRNEGFVFDGDGWVLPRTRAGRLRSLLRRFFKRKSN